MYTRRVLTCFEVDGDVRWRPGQAAGLSRVRDLHRGLKITQHGLRTSWQCEAHCSDQGMLLTTTDHMHDTGICHNGTTAS